MILKFVDHSKFSMYDTMFESGATIITISMIGDLITESIRKKANSDLSNLESFHDPQYLF